MEIYVLILLILFVNLGNRSNRSFYFQVICLFLIGLLRTETVGTDVMSYCELAESISSDFGATEDLAYMYADIEPGFIYLIKCFKIISLDPMFFIRGVFLLYFIGIYVSIIKLSSNPNYSLFAYFTLSFYFFSFNGIRQAFALSLILFVVSLLYQKTRGARDSNIKPYLWATFAIFIIGFLFHKSLIICSFIPFVIKYKDCKLFSNKLLIVVMCISMFCSIFLSGLIAKLFSVLDVSFLGNE